MLWEEALSLLGTPSAAGFAVFFEKCRSALCQFLGIALGKSHFYRCQKVRILPLRRQDLHGTQKALLLFEFFFAGAFLLQQALLLLFDLAWIRELLVIAASRRGFAGQEMTNCCVSALPGWQIGVAGGVFGCKEAGFSACEQRNPCCSAAFSMGYGTQDGFRAWTRTGGDG